MKIRMKNKYKKKDWNNTNHFLKHVTGTCKLMVENRAWKFGYEKRELERKQWKN